MESFQRAATRARRLLEGKMSIEEQNRVLGEILSDVLKTLTPAPAPPPRPVKTIAQLRQEQWARIKEQRERAAREATKARQYPGLTGENLARVQEQEYHLAAEKRDTLSYKEAVNLEVHTGCSKGTVFNAARDDWSAQHPRAKFPSRIPRELFFKKLEECEAKALEDWTEGEKPTAPKRKGRPPKAPPKSVIF